MLLNLLMLLGGLALIVKGGDFFVAAAIRLAEFLRMPRVVIGSTLVSLATTTPELVVSIMAGLRGESGLAVGNAVGSCICNIGLILGVTAGLKQVDVHFRALRTPLFAMFGFGALLFLMTLDLSLSRWQGGVLLLAGLGYFAWDFWRHWRERKPEDLAEAGAIKTEKSTARWAWVQTRTGTVVQFLFGAGIVVAGSRLLVEGAVGAAARLGVPSIVIGLTVVAVGTSLPELVTAVTSARKSVSDLAVGNVLGANIANLSLIVGAAAVIQSVGLDRLTQLFNFPALLAVMALLCWMLWSDRRVTRREGVTLLAVYGVYLAALVGITIAAAR
jgi:cation:H+ antiporter